MAAKYKCELCKKQTGSIEGYHEWAWCHPCQHGTKAETQYADVAASYHTTGYAKHNGDFEFLKTQWSSNIELLKKYSTGKTVLDVGFLEGSGMASMADAGYQTHGFDVSTQALELACKNGIMPSRLKVAKCLTDDMFDVRFDAVTCREVIEHVPDPRDLLMTIKNLMKPGAITQIQTPRFSPSVVFWNCPQHLRVFSLGSLISMAESIGLFIVDVMFWEGGMCLTFRKAG
tara:strand:+ start:273 stop:962 length:690 start_codon:yes stop_codon:yes gene_type:complete